MSGLSPGGTQAQTGDRGCDGKLVNCMLHLVLLWKTPDRNVLAFKTLQSPRIVCLHALRSAAAQKARDEGDQEKTQEKTQEGEDQQKDLIADSKS